MSFYRVMKNDKPLGVLVPNEMWDDFVEDMEAMSSPRYLASIKKLENKKEIYFRGSEKKCLDYDMNLVVYDPHAIHDLEKLPKDIQGEVIDKILFYSSQDNPLLFAKRLKNLDTGSYRFRIGNYRAIFDILKQKIVVLRIGHRSEIDLLRNFP